jgi:hypothetical protein
MITMSGHQYPLEIECQRPLKLFPCADAPSERAFVRTWPSDFQVELALAGLASKVVVVAVATTCRPQICDRFIVDPTTRALEITSAYRHEAAKALQRVFCNVKPSFYFDLCGLDGREFTLKVSNIFLRVQSQFCSYFDKLIGV